VEVAEGFLNQDVKSNAVGRRHPHNQEEWCAIFTLICTVDNGILRLSKSTSKQNQFVMRSSKMETILCSRK
jgi:hypothetical protein